MKLVGYAFYVIFGVSVVGGYGVAVSRGWEPLSAAEERRALPPEARSAPGAYRSHPVIWYGGFHGGK
ncbi:MAG: hypothetical protein OEY14_02555 [Myxococcales bacterium]|nr:hypothetical protein [Myxococcales bacterium]